MRILIPAVLALSISTPCSASINYRAEVIPDDPVKAPIQNYKTLKTGVWVYGNITACLSMKSFNILAAAEKNGDNILQAYQDRNDCDTLLISAKLGRFIAQISMRDGRTFNIFKIEGAHSFYVAVPKY